MSETEKLIGSSKADNPYTECLECGREIVEAPSKRLGNTGKVWRAKDPGSGTIMLCEPSPNGVHQPNLGSESGHTFRVSVVSRGSYSLAGVEGHTDAEDFTGEPIIVEVRAWNLTTAVARASNYSMSKWFASLDSDPSMRHHTEHALRKEGRVGRYFEENFGGAGAWEPCDVEH